MAKKNLPNIPLYIGDWLKDCNGLSMQAQGAWLQIVFKLWTNGKQNSCKMRAKALQNLWKCGKTEMLEILLELKEQDICPIAEIIEDGVVYYEITSRRFVKENSLSEIRSEAAKSSKTKAKTKQNKSKPINKKEQNTDIDIDIDNDNDYDNESVNENKKVVPLKIEKSEVVLPFDSEIFLLAWENWKEYKKKEFRFRYKSIQSEQAALSELNNLSGMNESTAIAIINQSMAKGWKGFFKLKKQEIETPKFAINR